MKIMNTDNVRNVIAIEVKGGTDFSNLTIVLVKLKRVTGK